MKNTLNVTPVGSIKFAAIARAIKNIKSGKEEFTIRLLFDGTTPEGMTFKKSIHQINDKKVVSSKLDKDGNETVPAGHFMVAFNSAFAPIVLDSEGKELKGREIPFFNSLSDSGTAVVTYTIGKQIPGSLNPPFIRLTGVKFIKLNLAPKEGGISSEDEITAKLNAAR